MLRSKVIRLTAKRRVATALARRISTVGNGPAEEMDVVIIGGGPAGLALATALGSSQAIRDSLRVTLIEAGDLSKLRNWAPPPGSFSNRVSSLTNASQAFLQSIGAWDHVDVSRTAPVEEMQVWDGISDARITFSASDLSLASPQMSRLTENLNLQRGLLTRLSALPHVHLLDNVKVANIVRESREGGGGWPIVHLSDGRTLRTRLLIGADGFNSPVRAYAGISSHGWAYPSHAIVATLSHAARVAPYAPIDADSSTNTIAYQRFLPTGPIAFLPLSETTSSLVWSTTPELAKALLMVENGSGGEGVLRALVNAAFRLPDVSMRHLHRLVLESGGSLMLGQVEEEIAWRERSHSIDAHSALSSSLSPQLSSASSSSYDTDLPPLITSIYSGTAASFPLRYNHADAYVGEGEGARTVLVGDAAHTVHPLAGQGLNMGLGDVEALVRCLEEGVWRGGDIGSYTALLPYARTRYLTNHTLMSAIDKLHKLYASTAEPVVWARSVGLEVLNELDAVKAGIMADAGARVNVTTKTRNGGAARAGGGWEVAARGVEGLVAGAGGAKLVGQALAGMVLGGVQSYLRGASGSGSSGNK